MKQNFFTFILISLLSSCTCCGTKEDKTYRETRFKTHLSPDFLPLLTGTIVFQSDSGHLIQFNKIETTHEYDDADMCEPEECCDHIVNIETKRIHYLSTKDNVSVGFSMISGDTSDEVMTYMAKYSSDPSEFTSSRITLDITTILNNSDSNCIFHDTITLGQKTYNNIYEFHLKYEGYENDKKFAKSIFYNKTKGLTAFILDDKSVWTKK